MFYELHQKVVYAFGKVFEKYGRFIARHPVKVICTVVIINIALAVGLLTLFNIFKSGLSLLDPNNTLVDVEILFHNVPCYINIVLQWHTDILIRGESLVCVCVLSVFV
jgi:TM2 domain-containing membrane protein YozV